MIDTPQRALHRYKVTYRRLDEPTHRVFQSVVIAASTDEAREQVRMIDPHYGSTVKPPRKLVTR